MIESIQEKGKVMLRENKYIVAEENFCYSPWGNLSNKYSDSYECFDTLEDAIEYANRCIDDNVSVEIFELKTIYFTKTVKALQQLV